MKHYLRLANLDDYPALFRRAAALKANRKAGRSENTLAGKTLALVFEKASTRTRLSFEAAMAQLGGACIDLPHGQSQLARGEPLSDTARVVSRYVDAIVFRTFSDERLEEFARHATVPVINGLSDGGHPVQVATDLFTAEERLGSIRGKAVAWIGDGAGNMARSWIEAAPRFGFTLRVASPAAFRPPPSLLAEAGSSVSLAEDPGVAAEGADVLTTDVWTSMGQESEGEARRRAFLGYTVDAALLSRAKPHCVVLHCLPAHRGEEITAEVLEGPRSAVFDEAENRMHLQKALLERLLAD